MAGLKDINLKELDNLSEEERKAVLEILKQYSTNGSSEIYDELKYSDYNEIPVTIEEFVDSHYYLGNAWHDNDGNSKLYPYWRKELRKIFPDNLSTTVNNAIFSGSRGRGKSEICVLMMAYQLYRVMCLKDPIAHFHLKPTEKIVFAFMNIKLALAEEIGITKFQNTIQSSPWFMQNGEISGKTNKIWKPKKYNNQVAIDIKIGSQADDLIGLPCYSVFFDEVSFQRNQDIEKQKQKAYNAIDTAIGGMKTRFVYKGINPTLLLLASSKRSEKSFLEEHMKKKLESEKENVYISDGSVWEVKPEGTYKKERFRVALGNKYLPALVIPDDEDSANYIENGYKILQVPVDFRPDFLDDIDRALCDFAGISSSEISKYISAQAVKDIIVDSYQNPFTREIIEVGNAPNDKAQYCDFFDLNRVPRQYMSKPLFIHLDMSISGDMTGISGVWITGKKVADDVNNQSKDLFFTLAFSVSVRAPKGRQISFEKNRNFIRWLKNQGFKIKKVTSDTFQSYDLQQQLKAEGFDCEILSVDRVDTNSHICVPYQYFRSTIYEKRLQMFKDDELFSEIIDLERNINTGKVDHPDGGRKDACDSFCGAVFEASKHADQFAFDYGESLDLMRKVSMESPANSTNQKQQVKMQFEDELRQLFTGKYAPTVQTETNNVENKTETGDKKHDNSNNKQSGPFLDFGVGSAQTYQPQYTQNGIILW